MLRSGVVDDDGRTKLRQYRIAKGIDSLHHVRVLRKMGWTLDDFEAGKMLERPSLPVPPPPELPPVDGIGKPLGEPLQDGSLDGSI